MAIDLHRTAADGAVNRGWLNGASPFKRVEARERAPEQAQPWERKDAPNGLVNSQALPIDNCVIDTEMMEMMEKSEV